jgi:hypothetical protein
LKKKVNLSVTNTIFQKNFSLSFAQAPTLKNIISPFGFGTPITAAAVAAGKLTGTLSVFDPSIKISPVETGLSINAVICFSYPKVDGDPIYKLISFSNEVASFDFNEPYGFEIGLKPEEGVLVVNYS